MDNKISMISINDMRLNDKVTEAMKKPVLDLNSTYSFNNVLFSIDDNDRITKIDVESWMMDDVKIEYDNNRLSTIEDFNKLLGPGEEEIINESDSSIKFITYHEGNLVLYLVIKENNINNMGIVKLKKKENQENKKEIFTSYVGMSSDEIKKIIKDKIELLSEKLNGNIDEQEKDNKGYLFWNCKMILRNIYMSCDKLANKFINELSNEEKVYYGNISNEIKNTENNWANMDDIRNIFNKIKL